MDPYDEHADRPRPSSRLRAPLLVAVAAALAVGIPVLVVSQHGDDEPEPAARSTGAPTTTAPADDDSVSEAPPTVPFVIDGRLTVDGERVPGEFDSVEFRDDVWIAHARDGSWWSGGPGLDPGPIGAELEQPPVISPGGGFVALVDVSDGKARLSGFDTQPAGEGFGQAPIDLPRTEDGVPIRVRAVTDDGDVVVQGRRTSLVWRAQVGDQRTVIDLAETAPDQQVLAATPAGLLVVDGMDSDPQSVEPYLADLSTDGRLERTAAIPRYDDLGISPGGTWLLFSPPGTLGGEVSAVDTLTTLPVAGGDEVVLRAPEGGGFAVGTWAWEDDRTLVAVLLPDGDLPPLPVRCDVTLAECRALALPGAEVRAYSPESTLDALLAAAAARDRGSLLDPAVVGDAEWDLLVGFADGRGGEIAGCRDNGEGTQDCEIAFEAAPEATRYAIVEPADTDYGWRVSYAGTAHD